MPSPRVARRRLLVFEPNAEGHSLEWLQHLIAFAGDGIELFVLAPKKICDALARTTPREAQARVHFLALSAWEKRLCLQRPLPIAAFASWWVMRRHLIRTNADSGFFLMIDLQSLPLALGLGWAAVASRYSLRRYVLARSGLCVTRRRLRDRRRTSSIAACSPIPRSIACCLTDPFFPAAPKRYCAATGRAVPDPAYPPVDGSSVASGFPPPGR